jgi:hypothetical protein
MLRIINLFDKKTFKKATKPELELILIVSNNASAVKIYNATSSLVRYESKKTVSSTFVKML